MPDELLDFKTSFIKYYAGNYWISIFTSVIRYPTTTEVSCETNLIQSNEIANGFHILKTD